ncbi:hypothetical protein [Aquimarina celericrescens]|uniref:Lysine transporter LysE n=1 Tax=Aquimarina celericrescens TaxID=1964542 RepID=A0ABW5B4L8_9FLAO|nr:hypothetical protein [Aquimarina celericrescens]
MTILYLLFGTLIAIIGAIPLGAVNLAVINTSIKENIRTASYIALAAGIGEVILAFFAIHCSLQLSNFLKENKWIQINFIAIFFLVGLYFILIANKKVKTKKSFKIKLTNSTLNFLPVFLLHYLILL